MYQLIIAICLLHITFAAFLPEPRIVNGKAIDISLVPYQVAICKGTRQFCGGSIISERYILTAAHCFTKRGRVGILVQAGSNTIDTSQAFKVKHVTVHPRYNNITDIMDIAILELEEPLKFSDKIKSVGLPKHNAKVPVGATGIAVGWGKLSDDGPYPKVLQSVELDFLSSDHCPYETFDKTLMICAGKLDKSADMCQGDSGGALVYNNIAYAISSFGYGCGNPKYPGVYTNVASLRTYIEEITGL